MPSNKALFDSSLLCRFIRAHLHHEFWLIFVSWESYFGESGSLEDYFHSGGDRKDWRIGAVEREGENAPVGILTSRWSAGLLKATACGKGFPNHLSVWHISHYSLTSGARTSDKKKAHLLAVTSGKCFHCINLKGQTSFHLIVFLLFGFCHNHHLASHYWQCNWNLIWPSKISPPCKNDIWVAFIKADPHEVDLKCSDFNFF